MLFGALEAGGTKMVCAVGDETGTILERISIPTKTPEETIPAILEFFREKSIMALGIGAFGPVDVKEGSETYGYILDTPKLSWKGFDLVGSIQKELNIPIGLDTDVNCACLGEVTFGCAKGLDTVIYITIGTGVGVGISINNKLHHGMLHPEAGHILLSRHSEDDYKGKCPYHENCLEGLASGPALEERWGKPAYELTEEAKVWELEAYYIAQALVNFILTIMPEKIILGGGVMHQQQMMQLIRSNVTKLLGGYIKTKEMRDMDDYIVPFSLNDNQAILGCFELAKRVYIK